jgi:ATP-dependent RNA helicase SUPV3L1/SUV3
MSTPAQSNRNLTPRPAHGVTAVLGPTNTGKTHLAIERLVAHDSGLIGLPLRLLAREVYDKVAARAGAANVALITGEEKIKPARPRYYICTAEAMPLDLEVDFLAVDEIQLAADGERGHVFTDRLFHARGNSETLMLGAATMRSVISTLLPGANMVSRPRLSELSYAGHKKLSRLPRRSAIVAFSAGDVYAIAELIRRQRGGAAVVMGALSPRTRNAQVELYQSGEVDFLVATDAIGMGLNLDVDHVAFASVRKFDGQHYRDLKPVEIAQIAGRAGRHMNDGTFGVTASVEPFEADLVHALQNHTFEDERVLQWRNRELDFASLDRLKASLQVKPDSKRLVRSRMVDDVIALENVSHDREIQTLAASPAALRRLWEVCQMPDYRKISSANHAELIADLYRHLLSDAGRIPEDWFAGQVAFADRTDGDIDTLANRIAHIRTWTFVSHRADWLDNPGHWQARTREIEDTLSDALHERLTRRFVDRRTSVLMRRLRDKDELHAEISDDGAVHVERHFVGRLSGFRFSPDSETGGIHGKAARHASAQVMTSELGRRAAELCASDDSAVTLTAGGDVEWRGERVARLQAGEAPLRPGLQLLADESLSAPDLARICERLGQWLDAKLGDVLEPLIALSKADDISGLARGVAFQLTENFGVLKREDVTQDIQALDQEARGQLRKYGVRFGALNIYLPKLLKPAAVNMLMLLRALRQQTDGASGPVELPETPREGLTSAAADPALSEAFYRVAGFHLCGKRLVRIDMLERLADMIRPLVSWRARDQEIQQPEGATGNGGFRVQPEMMSIMGCSGDDFAEVLRALGFRCERRPLAQAQDLASGNPGSQAAAASADGAGEQALAAEPAFDEIWRPRKRPKNGRDRVERTAKAKRTVSRAPKAEAKKTKHRRPAPAKAAPKPARVDPDSPFAALESLRDELARGSGEQA